MGVKNFFLKEGMYITPNMNFYSEKVSCAKNDWCVICQIEFPFKLNFDLQYNSAVLKTRKLALFKQTFFSSRWKIKAFDFLKFMKFWDFLN